VFIKGEQHTHLHNRIDRVLALSNEHRKYLHGYHNIPMEKILISSNGIDLTRFDEIVEVEPYRLIWSSSLDRGFDVLALDIFPRIREVYPEATLEVFYGISGWEEAIEWKKANGKLLQWELNLWERVQKGLKQENVFYHGRIGQDQLAKQFLKSSYWFQPTIFTETFCITALEAMASQCAIVASDYWGIKDTVKEAGVLVLDSNRSPHFQDEFVKECLKMMGDEKHREAYIQKGLDRVQRFKWSNVANQIDTLLKMERGMKFNREDFIGQRFGRLVVLGFIEVKNKNSHWKCKCECGNETVTSFPNLRRSKSCGCIQGNKNRLELVGQVFGRLTVLSTKGFKGSEIGIDGKSKHLGYFTSETEAAKVYNKAAEEAWGSDAYLNKVLK